MSTDALLPTTLDPKDQDGYSCYSNLKNCYENRDPNGSKIVSSGVFDYSRIVIAFFPSLFTLTQITTTLVDDGNCDFEGFSRGFGFANIALSIVLCGGSGFLWQQHKFDCEKNLHSCYNKGLMMYCAASIATSIGFLVFSYTKDCGTLTTT